jgi:hypothetical protein
MNELNGRTHLNIFMNKNEFYEQISPCYYDILLFFNKMNC